MNPIASATRSMAAALCLAGAASAAPVFSVPGFVDETVYQGNGMISMRFDFAGRLWVCEKQGRVLVFEPNPGGPSTYQYDYYETGPLSVLPDFSTLTPVKSGVTGGFLLDQREREDDFAFRYTGTIHIDSAGLHMFYLSSDDGSRLFIDDSLVVDYDGTHGAGEQSGGANLTAGEHDIRVEYFERGGGQSLKVEYEGPGLARGPVARGAFKQPVVFADFSPQVNTDGERGMTGMTLDPDLADNRHVYVLFATANDQRILRLTSNPGFTAMLPGSDVVILSGLPNTNTVHKAGDIGFHPNDPNHLYVMLGDDGERYFVSNLDNYNGKLLKINSADGLGPADNPFFDGNPASVRSRIWAHSFRNPFRFAFDPEAPVGDVLFVSENGDGTDRIARIAKGADGAWPTSDYLVSSGDGKRRILQTSDPSKTGIAIVRSGPLAPDGNPVLYHARYGGGDRNEVLRWTLGGPDFDTLIPLAADGGAAFYSGYTDHQIVSFTAGPDGALYYTDSGQGQSLSTSQKLGRIRFVGGTPPLAAFAADRTGGEAPLAVAFTDDSSAPGSSISSWHWDFGDGGTSGSSNPSHVYQNPGVYQVSLVVTNASGLTDVELETVTVSHQTSLALSGRVLDARSLPAAPLNGATELRFYQADGITPLSFSGGIGTDGNAVAVEAGGVFDLNLVLQITGAGVVVSAGEPAEDGMAPALVGIPLSTVSASQTAGIEFRLSNTMLRGRVTDTLGNVARVDLGLSRDAAGQYFGFDGGRDFLPDSSRGPSGVGHRIVPDELGYYHMPIPSGAGDARFFVDTAADTLASSHGKVDWSDSIATGVDRVWNPVIGLYDGGTGESDLSGIAAVPGVDFAARIQPIFSSYCVACHNDIATNSGGLDLDPGAAFAGLVNRPSTEAHGVKLVEPGNPARSYLMEKINASLPQAGTSMRPGDPMSLADRALIRDWITQLDPAGSVEFVSSTVVVTEMGQGTLAPVRIRRNGGNSSPVSVVVATVPGGTADEGSDYDAVSTVLTWAAGEDATKTVNVPIHGDGVVEGTEQVMLALQSPGGGVSLGALSSTVLEIHDRPFDEWRFQTFGPEANSPSASAGEDFDNDGNVNLIEYALGSDPKTPQGASVAISLIGTEEVTLKFRRAPVPSDVQLAVEACEDLAVADWTLVSSRTAGTPWSGEPGVSVQEDADWVSVTVPRSFPATSSFFLRLRATLIPQLDP